MPLIRIIQIDPDNYQDTKIGIWHIAEPESFFATKVKIEREVHHPHKRLQHMAARYLLSAIEPDFPMADIKISRSGKPYLPGKQLHFSLAHGGDYAVAIISRRYRVGIDVEKITPKIERVAAKFLGEAELAFIDNQMLLKHLTVCWSAKEAVFKWYGDRGVDFRQNIDLQPFPLLSCGCISCIFQKDHVQRDLSVFYQTEGEYVVAWLANED